MENVTNVPQTTKRICAEKFGKLMLRVETCTQSTNGGFIVKLVNTSEYKIKTAFGTKTTTVKHTFYMKLDEAVPVDFVAEQNIDELDVVEYLFVPTDDDGTAIETDSPIWLKWLQITTATNTAVDSTERIAKERAAAKATT